jgi:hypothetical protein
MTTGGRFLIVDCTVDSQAATRGLVMGTTAAEGAGAGAGAGAAVAVAADAVGEATESDNDGEDATAVAAAVAVAGVLAFVDWGAVTGAVATLGVLPDRGMEVAAIAATEDGVNPISTGAPVAPLAEVQRLFSPGPQRKPVMGALEGANAGAAAAAAGDAAAPAAAGDGAAPAAAGDPAVTAAAGAGAAAAVVEGVIPMSTGAPPAEVAGEHRSFMPGPQRNVAAGLTTEADSAAAATAGVGNSELGGGLAAGAAPVVAEAGACAVTATRESVAVTTGAAAVGAVVVGAATSGGGETQEPGAEVGAAAQAAAREDASQGCTGTQARALVVSGAGGNQIAFRRAVPEDRTVQAEENQPARQQPSHDKRSTYERVTALPGAGAEQGVRSAEALLRSPERSSGGLSPPLRERRRLFRAANGARAEHGLPAGDRSALVFDRVARRALYRTPTHATELVRQRARDRCALV